MSKCVSFVCASHYLHELPLTNAHQLTCSLQHQYSPSHSHAQERAPFYMPHLPAFLSGQSVPGMEAPAEQKDDGKSSSSRRSALLREIQQFVCSLKQVGCFAFHCEVYRRTGSLCMKNKCTFRSSALSVALHTQEPVLRTRYKRAAFQRSDTNEVRISLDTNVSDGSNACYMNCQTALFCAPPVMHTHESHAQTHTRRSPSQQRPCTSCSLRPTAQHPHSHPCSSKTAAAAAPSLPHLSPSLTRSWRSSKQMETAALTGCW